MIPWLVYGSVAIMSVVGLCMMRGPLGAVRGNAGEQAIATVETTDGGETMQEHDEIWLTLPHPRFRESFLDAMREFQEAEEDDELPASLDVIEADFDGFVERIITFSASPVVTFVPQSPFWIVSGDAYIGRLDIRHRLNEKLLMFGGHIVYDIRPSMRRRGYGTQALALGLAESRKLGLEQVLVTCSEYNVASKKIIEANGGVLENMVETPFREELTCRYWIDVPS